MNANTINMLGPVELAPVIELEPCAFATEERKSPSGTDPAEWSRYWFDSLADSGVEGLTPIRTGSWHVATKQLGCPVTLSRILDAYIRSWGGIEALSDPESRPVFNGGLSLFADEQLLIEPACCSDLGNLSEWQTATEYGQPEWKMVWIGHPWISVRFENGNLLLSKPHESNIPVACWAVQPDELKKAVASAITELEDFSRRLRVILGDMCMANAVGFARMLSGLPSVA